MQDGQSTDATLDILRSFGSRINVISEPDQGPGDAFWRALKRCRGEIIGSCQSDEQLLPDAVQSAVDYLALHQDVGAIYGDVLVTDKSGNIRHPLPGPEPFQLIHYLSARTTPNFLASFFRRSALERIGLYSRSWAQDCGEFELWGRLALTSQIRHIGKCMGKYAIHTESLSSNPENAIRLCIARHRIICLFYRENRDTFGSKAIRDDCILSTYLIFFAHLGGLGHIHAAKRLIAGGALRLFRQGAVLAGLRLGLKLMKESLKSTSNSNELIPKYELRHFWISLNAGDYESAYKIATVLASTLSKLDSALVSVPQFLSLYNFLNSCKPGIDSGQPVDRDNTVILKIKELFQQNRVRCVSAFKDKSILYKTWLSQRYLDEKSIWGILNHFGYHRIAVFGGAALGRAIYRDLCDAQFSVPAIVDSNYAAYAQDFPRLPWMSTDYLSNGIQNADLMILTIEGTHDVQVQNQLTEKYKISKPVLFWKDFVTLYYDRNELSDFISPNADFDSER